jgi:hypothetical protein
MRVPDLNFGCAGVSPAKSCSCICAKWLQKYEGARDRSPWRLRCGDLKVSRTHFLRLGWQRAPGLRRLPHCSPGWRACLRLAPAATPSSSRRRANPRLSSEAIALQQCRPLPPSACAAGLILRPCLRQVPRLAPGAYLPATPLVRPSACADALSLGATGAEPPAFTGRRISSLRWRLASVFRQKP